MTGAATDSERPPERSAEELDLRILTPGLSDEEIAAVTSVVAAMIEEQRDAAVRAQDRAPSDRWRRSVGEIGASVRGPEAWLDAAR